VPLPTITGDATPSRLLVNPILDSREAETTVTIEDGSTLVFGGLRLIRTTSRESKIPGLGDLPGLGWLFKNHRSQKQQTDLYFFVTPTLL
jgi:type II secretory pathway component GspD/PulD (secretin)